MKDKVQVSWTAFGSVWLVAGGRVEHMCRRVAADITSQWDERAGDLLGLCPRCDAVRLLDSIVGLARFGRATRGPTFNWFQIDVQ